MYSFLCNIGFKKRLNNRLHRFTRRTSISGSSSMMVQVCSPRSA